MNRGVDQTCKKTHYRVHLMIRKWGGGHHCGGLRKAQGSQRSGGLGGVRGLTQPPWSWIQPSSRSRRKSSVQPMMVLISWGTLVHRACGEWAGP